MQSSGQKHLVQFLMVYNTRPFLITTCDETTSVVEGLRALRAYGTFQKETKIDLNFDLGTFKPSIERQLI